MIKPDGKRNIREIITDQVMEEAPIEATGPTVSKKNIAQIIPKKMSFCLRIPLSFFFFIGRLLSNILWLVWYHLFLQPFLRLILKISPRPRPTRKPMAKAMPVTQSMGWPGTQKKSTMVKIITI